MATVTVFTAERMQAIEDGTVVDGTIVGDDLILIKHDNSQVNVGSVRGPAGPPGPIDPADLSLVAPVGIISPYGGTTAPTGWLLCDGSSYLRSTYQDLYNVIGTHYGSVDSTHFNVPDLRQRVPLGKSSGGPGDVIGSTGGSKDAVAVGHTHATDNPGNHGHTALDAGNHGHTAQNAGNHNHTQVTGNVFAVSVGGYQNHRLGDTVLDTLNGPYITYTYIDPAGVHSHSTDGQGTHGHSTSAQGGHTHTAQSSGVSGTDANLQPYVTVNYIIRY